MLAENGASGLALGDIATIAIVDDPERCGAVGDALPSAEAYPGAGQWVPLEVFYRAATADGPATIDRVSINGVVVQEGLALEDGDRARGALSVLGSGEGVKPGSIAVRNIQVKPLDRPSDAGEWTFLDPVSTWDEWDLTGDAAFELNGDEIDGRGARGHLWAPIEGVGDVTFRAQAKVNANGAGAVVLRANETDDGVEGYAVRINSSFPDETLTGSIARGGTSVPVATELIAADTWVDLEVRVKNEDDAARVTVLLNGIIVNEFVDESPLPPGGIALRCDHEGTIFKLQNLRIQR